MKENELLNTPSKAESGPFLAQQLSSNTVPRKLEIDGESVRNGLAQLVLTLVKLLHE